MGLSVYGTLGSIHYLCISPEIKHKARYETKEIHFEWQRPQNSK